MRNELLKELQLEDLSGSARELAELVGMEAFLNLVDVYGGSSNLDVPTAKQLINPVRDELIRREFNGHNIDVLARRWDLTERYIREIVKEKAARFREERQRELLAPPPGQMTFWETKWK